METESIRSNYIAILKIIFQRYREINFEKIFKISMKDKKINQIFHILK